MRPAQPAAQRTRKVSAGLRCAALRSAHVVERALMRMNKDDVLMATLGLIATSGLIIGVSSSKPEQFHNPAPGPALSVRSLVAESETRLGQRDTFDLFIQLQEYSGQ